MNRLLLATTLLALNGAARADFASDFLACAALDNGAERLGCYDALARRGAGLAPPTQPAIPAAPAAPALSQEQRFGLESVAEKPESERDAEAIQARYQGEFKGWAPKSQFVLDNGQVWKNVGGDSVYYPAGTNPAVRIEKGAFGAYWLSVEGLNRKAKVKRVK